MLGLPDIAIGAVFAAIITGAITLLGLIISKEQKVSEFRQDWINSLRAEIAALIAHANALHMATFQASGEKLRDDIVGINIATAQIRLRLNPSEETSVPILDCILELETALNRVPAPHFEHLNEIEKRLARHAQRLLKQEWNRVRRGEAMFRIAKYAAMAVILVLPLALLLRAVLRA